VMKKIAVAGPAWYRRLVPVYIGAAAMAAGIMFAVIVPNIINRPSQETQIVAQADWEVLENYDVVKDLDVIEAMDNVAGLEEEL